MIRRTATALCLASLIVAGCSKQTPAESTEPAAAAEPEPAPAQADAPPASREVLFKVALIAFAESGDVADYKILLSKRMLTRHSERQAELDKDPKKRAELAKEAKALGLPETATMVELSAAVWHQGLKPSLEQMRTAEIVVIEDGERLRVEFKGVESEGDPVRITVADEDGVLKIDEN